jgi:hypothetical protein
VSDLDASEREAGGDLASRSDASGEPPKGALAELDAKVLRAERSTETAFELVEQPDLRARRDRDAEVQAEHMRTAPKYWARTRARLDKAELERPIGHVTVPPLAAEEQPSTD